MPRSKEELNKIANDVVGEVWSDSRLYVPVYRADIKTEAQANAATDLPLLYIWNEVVENSQLKGFSFSINGPIIGKMLERHLPRTDPDFVFVRDTIMRGIHGSQNQAVMEVCAKARKRPSELYGRR